MQSSLETISSASSSQDSNQDFDLHLDVSTESLHPNNVNELTFTSPETSSEISSSNPELSWPSSLISKFFKKPVTNLNIEPTVYPSNDKPNDQLDSNDPALSQVEFNSTLKPIRPSIKTYSCNEKGNKFNPHWYTQYSWLEYSKTKNAAFCFTCRHFGENNSKKKNVYTDEGYTDFRKAAEKLKLHNECQTHKTATPVSK